MTHPLAARHPLRLSVAMRWTLLALLAGCGGGGGGGDVAPPPPPPDSRLAGLVCSATAGRGWCWQAPLPSAESVNAVQFGSPQVGLVAGQAGYLQRTTDGGRSWTRLLRTGFDFVDLALADAQTGWARSTELPIVLKTRDGGLTWDRQATGMLGFAGAPSGLKLEVFDRDTALVRNLLPGGGLSSLTRDGGATWTQVPTPATPILPGGLYWSVTERTLRGLPTRFWDYARHTDWGATSTALGPLPGCAAQLWPLGPQRIVAQCSEGGVSGLRVPPMFVSDDGGLSWRDLVVQIPAPASAAWRLKEVRLDGAGEGLAVLRDLTPGRESVQLLRVSQGATRWEPLALPDSLRSFALPDQPILDDRALWLVDAAGRAQFSADRGQGWAVVILAGESGRPQRLTRDAFGGWLAEYFEIRRAPDGTPVSGPELPRFYRSADGGTTWLAVPGSLGPDARRTVRGLAFIDSRRGFALDDDGGLRETADGGLTWRRRPAVPGGIECCAFSGALQFAGSTAGWMIDRGRLLATSNGGADWTLATVPSGMSSLVDLQFIDARQGWAVSEGGALFSTTDGGATWVAATKPPGVVKLVRFANAQVGAAMVNDGVFYDAVWHTRDGGRTWTITNFQGHSGEDIVALRYADASQLTMIGRRRDKERLWRSSDGGATWRAGVLPVANLGLHALQFVDGRRGRIVGDGGIVLATEDAGDSWTVVDAGPIGEIERFASAITMFWLDADTGWLGGGSGSILATVTGGRR